MVRYQIFLFWEVKSDRTFTIVQPDNTFATGLFSVTPILADHGADSPGAVTYLAKLFDKKIIIGWDFVSLPRANENLFWNPDLLILGRDL
jgi:hypothetical protein